MSDGQLSVPPVAVGDGPPCHVVVAKDRDGRDSVKLYDDLSGCGDDEVSGYVNGGANDCGCRDDGDAGSELYGGFQFAKFEPHLLQL